MIQKTNSVITVNRSLLIENLQVLSRFLDSDTQVMAVVKSNAYGHGAVKIAQTLEPRVEAFAVNAVQEGIELRENGIDKPVLVFEAPRKKAARKYRMHNLTATVSAREHFELLSTGTSYHLNFDTGMGRLGFPLAQAAEVARMVREYRELSCTGIYSHFATAHEPGFPFVGRQHQTFCEIRSHFPENLDTHIANTGGAVFYNTRQFNMVRLGIGLYGYAPGGKVIEGIKPILSWRTYLAQIKEIKPETTVSYGAAWEAPANGYLAILPVGYEDGIKRNLFGRLTVRIAGKEYKVVGTITMNYCMAFLGDDYYEPGTEVELLYPGSSAYDWAGHMNTIPYEILTSLDIQTPREYI